VKDRQLARMVASKEAKFIEIASAKDKQISNMARGVVELQEERDRLQSELKMNEERGCRG